MAGRLNSMSRFNSTTLGVICGIGASLFWAVGFVGVRDGLDAGFSPTDLVIHRYLALLPFVMQAGINDLNGIGWGRASCWQCSAVLSMRSSGMAVSYPCH
jgi:drug/metabolite transporter (DMT)-like permease